MSTHPHPSNSNSIHISPDDLVIQMQNFALSPSADPDTTSSDNSLAPVCPFVSYTQVQILSLYKSPLVAPPRGMPPLKDWFGYAVIFIPFSVFDISFFRDWNEHNASKKDTDTSAAASGARDKRYVLFGASSVTTSFSLFLASDVIKKMRVHSSFLLYVPSYTHQFLGRPSPAGHLPINVVSALANGKL